MKYLLRKHLILTILSIILCIYTVLTPIFYTHAAEIDYDALSEARKSLPVASNEIENWPQGPLIGAESAILMDAATGTVLYEKNVHEELYPASTTKILTALLAIENISLDEKITFSQEAVFSIERGSSNMGMDMGEQITMEQALYGLLVQSANEVGNALAEHVAGTTAEFAAMMNQKASELGCLNSNFVNPHGLQDENHYTTSYDLALIAKSFFSNELLSKISGTYSYDFNATSSQPDTFTIHSKNKFLNGECSYDFFVGGKTGFTSDSRQTLVSCAEKNGMKLICVVMKEESPLQFTDTIELFDYGFDNFQKINVSQNETKYTVDSTDFFSTNNDIFGDSKPILSINESDCVLIPKTITFSDLTSTLSYNPEEDDSIAQISYEYNGVSVGNASMNITASAENTFDFQTNEVIEAVPEETEEDNVIFLNITKMIFLILGIAGLLIVAFIVRAFIKNYEFSVRRSWKAKKKKRHRSDFDDFNF